MYFHIFNIRRVVASLLPLLLCCYGLNSGCTSLDDGSTSTARDQRQQTDVTLDQRGSDQQRSYDRADFEAGSARETRSSDRSREQNQAEARNVMAYPTGDKQSSVVMLEADAPQQVMVGQRFTYRLRVTNLTDMPLHDVAVRDLAAAQSRGATTRGATAQADSTNDNDAQLASARESRSSSDSQAAMWSVGTLAPKQTVTHEFTTTADQIGAIRNCLAVSYQPTLCMAVNVVKPELQIEKQGPSEALICEPLVYSYRVTNTGTGSARAVRIEDPLPNGLTTADGGARVFTANVGDLQQGQSKQVTARLQASRAGQFASRAIARGAGLEVRSGEVSTVVRAPVLSVSVNAPEWRYAGEAIDYRVAVKNTGDAAAENAVIKLMRADGGEPLGVRQLGTIPPGQTSSFIASMKTPATPGTQRVQAIAEARCAAPARGDAAVAIKVVPALRMECVDQMDPVRVGNNTIYTLNVKNQGSGPDSNVALRATLPPELQFVRADGASKVTANGQELTFAPLATLGPGEVASWNVEVKATRAADVKFEVQLKSDSLGNQAATETEPTRLID